MADRSGPSGSSRGICRTVRVRVIPLHDLTIDAALVTPILNSCRCRVNLRAIAILQGNGKTRARLQGDLGPGIATALLRWELLKRPLCRLTPRDEGEIVWWLGAVCRPGNLQGLTDNWAHRCIDSKCRREGHQHSEDGECMHGGLRL